MLFSLSFWFQCMTFIHNMIHEKCCIVMDSIFTDNGNLKALALYLVGLNILNGLSVPYIRILVILCLATFHSITKYTIQIAFDVRWFIWKFVCAYHILNVTISSTLPLALANSLIPFNRLVHLYSQNILTIHVCG